jgi:sulfhydrogenase subunit beta (sulfur reductase)
VTAPSPPPRVLPAERLDALIAALRHGGRAVLGPTARDGAIMTGPVERAADLPRGWTDDQGPGRYRLQRGDGGGAYFGFTIGPDSMKALLFPARLRLWRAARDGDSFRVEPGDSPPGPVAVIGPRSCDLAAAAIQDRVLRNGPHQDPHYAARRADLLIVAVQCNDAAATCFCSSMGSGPRVRAGFDLCLTEVLDDNGHVFVVEVGSPAGAEVLERLDTHEADAARAAAPDAAGERAAARIAKSLPDATSPKGLREDLLAALEGPHWEAVASRCLGCANCTMVCPTCFCSEVTDLTDLTGAAERVRTWDSCFTLSHSHVHGGSVRASPGSRYRQWLTHKLGTWWDQFDTAGCVGCGRCTTWCPAGIDLVAEAMAASGRGAETPTKEQP